MAPSQPPHVPNSCDTGPGRVGPSAVPAPSTPSQRRAVVAVLGAAILLGTTGTAAQLGPDSLGATTAAAWRAVIGAACLVGFSTLRGVAPWRFPARPIWVVLGAGAAVLNQVCFFAAIERAGVAVATLVTISAIPVTAGVIDGVVGRRLPSSSWVLGVALSICGVALLSGGPGGSIDRSGIAVAAVSGIGAGVVGFAAQRLMQDRPVLPAMSSIVGVAALALAPTAMLGAGDALDSPASVLTVGYLGVVTLGVAYALYGTGLDRASLGTVAAIGLAEPAVAAALAIVVLGEPVTWNVAAGIAVVLAGVAVNSLRPAPPADLDRRSERKCFSEDSESPTR